MQGVEERVHGAPAVVARGEFDLERIGACSDEVEDLGVLLDRVLSAPWNRGEGRLADAGEPRPAAVHEIEQVRVGARLEQHRMELAVELGEGVRVEVVEHLRHPIVDPGGLLEGLVVEQGSGQGGGAALDEAERLHRVRVLALIHEGHPRADVALERHEPFGLETADRLAHGDDAHLEIVGDGSQHQPVSGAEHVSRDAGAQPLVRDLGLARGRRGHRVLPSDTAFS